MAQSNGDELAKYLLANYSLSAGEANHLAHFIEQDRKQYELEARLSEAKLLDRRVADEFDKLCREVESNPNLGNSSKGKKDNFLDGAESMIRVASIRIAELIAEREGLGK